MSGHYYIACDLGAESGRVILGRLENNRLGIEEIHRFPTATVRVGDSTRWDAARIFAELKTGLSKIAVAGIRVESVSVDSWGVDYALFNSREMPTPLEPPRQYRDPRTDAIYRRVMDSDLPALIFEETGIQFMSINTLYHMIADVKTNQTLLCRAECFLNMADYFNYLLSGNIRAEESLASTTQIYNPRTRSWSGKLITQFHLARRLFPPIVQPGTKLGPLKGDVSTETGLVDVEVIATCSHDTGAAVAAVPAGKNGGWAYLSSGTWSLIGVELPAPLINEKVRAYNYTNEAGYGGTTRFLKNITGLWILQECRRAWGGSLDYEALNTLAAREVPLCSIIDPDDPRFLKPDDMPEKIAAFCRETGQHEPVTKGQFIRCILESLALLYGHALDEIETLTGRTIRTLYIVGGGSKSRLLNQYTANATGRTVIAGPVEATAIGNLLIQAIALGHVQSLDALRDIVRESFPVQIFKPADVARWQSARGRFSKFTASTGQNP